MRRTAMAVSGAVLTLAAVGQIVLCFLLFGQDGSGIARYIGWGLLCLSAIFGWLPILTLKRSGGVPKRRSYTETSVLVDRGIYAVVRHPQYLAGVFLGAGLSLIAQHWLVALLGGVVMVVSYVGTYPEERALMDKFGAQYEEYADRVPRTTSRRGWGEYCGASRSGWVDSRAAEPRLMVSAAIA